MIDTAKEKINSLAAKVKTSEQAAARIASSKSQIQVPAGTLAEVDAQIISLEVQLKEAQENFTQIRMEEQKAADTLKAKEEADRREKERIEREEKAKAERPGEMTKKSDALLGAEKVNGIPVTPGLPGPVVRIPPAFCVASSIQAIMNAMDDAGCGTCTAKMIARRELRKYQEVNQEVVWVLRTGDRDL
jgi:chromosome segregation ATPase